MFDSKEVAEYWLYVEFTAISKALREVKTETEFKAKYKLADEILRAWDRDPEFWEDVKWARKKWANEKESDVIAAVYARIMKTGDPNAAKLWLQYVRSNWDLPKKLK